MMNSKYLILLGDGMADWPIQNRNNKTPLEIATIPEMDWISQSGQAGLVKTIPDNCAPGSDIANMSILGYNPTANYTGRGPIEAANLSIDYSDHQLAFRCNLVTIIDNIMIDFTAGHIPTDDANEIINELNQYFHDQPVSFHTGTSYRHIAILPDRYQNISTVPPHDITDQSISNFLPKGTNANEITQIMNQSRIALQNSPTNQKRIQSNQKPVTQIWLWSQGAKPHFQSFESIYGLKGAVITAVDLLKGIGKLIGFDTPEIPGATGFIDTNYNAKINTTLTLLDSKDLVYVHIEAPDEAGHMGDVNLKIKAIELINNQIVRPALTYQKTHPNLKILLLPDHPTPCEIKTHAKDPVPFAIYYPGISPIPAASFSESSHQKTDLFFETGKSLLDHFLYIP